MLKAIFFWSKFYVFLIQIIVTCKSYKSIGHRQHLSKPIEKSKMCNKNKQQTLNKRLVFIFHWALHTHKFLSILCSAAAPASIFSCYGLFESHDTFAHSRSNFLWMKIEMRHECAHTIYASTWTELYAPIHVHCTDIPKIHSQNVHNNNG